MSSRKLIVLLFLIVPSVSASTCIVSDIVPENQTLIMSLSNPQTLT